MTGKKDGRQGTHAEPNTFPSYSPLLLLSNSLYGSLGEQKQERPGWSVISQLTDFPFPDLISFVKKEVNLPALCLSPVGYNAFCSSHFLEYCECATAGQSQSGQPGGVKRANRGKVGNEIKTITVHLPPLGSLVYVQYVFIKCNGEQLSLCSACEYN